VVYQQIWACDCLGRSILLAVISLLPQAAPAVVAGSRGGTLNPGLSKSFNFNYLNGPGDGHVQFQIGFMRQASWRNDGVCCYHSCVIF